MRRGWQIAESAAFFVALVLAWEALVRLLHIKAYLLPTPSEIVVAGWERLGTLFSQTLITFYEVMLGFACALGGGILIALGIFVIPLLRRTLYPLVVAFQGTPKVALAPLIVVWIGYGTSSKVLMSFLFAFFPIVISTLGGLSSTPLHLEEHFRALRAPVWVTFWRLRIPNALPNLIDGCKVAMPLAVIGAIVGEFVGSDRGLGNLIVFAAGSSRTDLTFAAIIFVTLLSLVLYGIIEYAGRFVWWRGR
jgi:NitT/TauT family transport system permease protein